MENQQIHLLPEHIIDQIKAGEVIERPSTLIKEVLENSLDAESSQIEIHIKDNGLELISIEDDGKGIPAAELPLAFCRHATSKISRFEDVYHLSSFGFRGEALASIASISKLSCESTQNNRQGIIKIEGGETKTHTDHAISSESGTKIYIKDLFYNTPVRMKFIQSKTSEKNQIIKILRSFLLANPQVGFKIKWDQSEKEIYPKTDDIVKRISQVTQIEANDLLSEQAQYDGLNCQIYLSKSSNKGNAHKHHYIFINKRYIQDVQIHKIILNSAKNLWPDGETGHYILLLDIPADEIDVNVHPNKTKIKFFQGPKVFSLVSATINQIFHHINKENSFKHSQEQQAELLSTPKDVHYREHSFHSQEGIKQYFENLHTTQVDQPATLETEASAVLNTKKYFVFTKNENLWCLDKKCFFQLHIRKLLEEENLKDNTVPLMVSRPIKINRSNIQKNLNILNEYGFEVDLIASDTALLRSFPKDFQHYPFIQFVESHLNQSISDFPKKINTEFLNDFDMSFHTVIELMRNFAFTDLIENNVIKNLNDQNLAKLYE